MGLVVDSGPGGSRSESSAARLPVRVHPPETPPYEIELSGDVLTVGRSSDCALRLDDRFLSRHHCQIFRRGSEWWIEDLGSRNGTFRNHRAVVAPTLLHPGDKVRISRTVLVPWPEQQEPSTAAEESTAAASKGRNRSTADLDRPPVDRRRPDSGRVLAANRLQLMNDVHEALGEHVALDDLMELILDRIFLHLEPDEASIYFRQARAASMELIVRRTADEADDRPPFDSGTLIAEVVETKQPILASDVARDDRFRRADSVERAGVRSLLAAPLDEVGDTRGVIVLSSGSDRRRFEAEDRDLLGSLASAASLRLSNMRLYQADAERKRLEDELEIARRIQLALLPTELPEIPGFELRARNLPFRGVSGDIYMIVPRQFPDEWVFVLADVSGKGMSASLLASSLEALIAGPIEVGRRPDEICARTSRRLFARTPAERFATAFVAVLRPGDGHVAFCNAGHNPALITRSGGTVDLLGATGVPIGLLPGATYDSEATHLGLGDTLILYTDGLTESESPDSVEFGLERLTETCREVRARSLEEIETAIFDALEAHTAGLPSNDDRTLLLLRRSGS